DDPAVTSEAVREAMEPHDVVVELLPAGLVLVTPSAAGSATDQAQRAARCALRLRELVPSAPIGLAAGYGVISGSLGVTGVLDRAVALLESTRAGVRGPGIRLDDVVAGLLDTRFEIHGDTSGLLLSAERDPLDVTRKLLGKPTTCVGRDAELMALDAIY